ncbi:MAG: aminopeptidase P family protein [Clostridiaceae bacterium]|nr:aminopeptidase P family protein [Clostridiaceae bacterium]
MIQQIENRLKRLREKLKDKDVDAVLVTRRENYIYLSGFTGSFAYLVITQNDACLITDFRYTEQASQQAPLYEIIQYNQSLLAALSDVIQTKGIEKLGFEDDYITYKKYNELHNGIGAKHLIPFQNVLEGLRIKKDNEELEKIRKAVEIADSAFSHILKFLKPGIKEYEVSAELEFYMKKSGAKGASFDTIVASGKRSSLPHGVASGKTIENGDAVTLDYGAIFEDYCSDMTRTVFIGSISKELKNIYNIVLEAQTSALVGAKRGYSGKEVDIIARDIISKSGYEKNFGHGLGHGVGIEVHEEPRLSPKGEIKLDNGMVVTVEPGIYVNDLGGVRIEDMIIINDDKPIILTSSTKEIIVL